MLDSFDVMLYALMLASIMAALGIRRRPRGCSARSTLLAAAAGGIIFGVIADRFGRTQALMASVLIYSVFTAACGLAQTAAQLAVFRILLGIGMGGEWASGAALVSETWRRRASRQGARLHAERVGDRLCRGRVRHDARAAAVGLARGLLRRHPAGLLHALGARATSRSRALWREDAATRARDRCADIFKPGRCCASPFL